MVITYYGLECFKVQFGETVLAFNPPSKKSKHTSPSFGADIVLVTTHHPDMNGIEHVSRGDKKPFAITGAGEYEVNGVSIKGFETKTAYGGLVRNTAYLVRLEDMYLLFLGALSDPTLPPEVLEEFEAIDILFVPVGENGTLSPHDAHKLGVSLEPHLVIPMHYTSDSLGVFLKEEGNGGTPVDKLTVKKKDLVGKEGEVIVLEAQ